MKLSKAQENALLSAAGDPLCVKQGTFALATMTVLNKYGLVTLYYPPKDWYLTAFGERRRASILNERILAAPGNVLRSKL